MIGPEYRKSSFSQERHACVEVATGGDSVLVRDSKNPNGPKLTFTLQEWTAFVAGVRNNEFDH